MKVIRERSIAKATSYMRDVKLGDVVLVDLRGKGIPCVVVMCSDTQCRRCVINNGFVVPACRSFRGNTNTAFIPIEETVE